MEKQNEESWGGWDILVLEGFHNKVPQTGGLKTTGIYYLRVQG